jgi:putative ABC transport system permease protein
MQWIEAFRLALQSLNANKLRSLLTTIGVIISVSSVILVVTLANGAKQFVTSKLNTYGAATVTISKMPDNFYTIEEYLEFQKRRDVTYDDYKAVLDKCTLCALVGAERTSVGKVVYGKQNTTDTTIRGWTWTMPSISNKNISLGRIFTQTEDEHAAHVAIVGADIVDNMLGAGDPLGKEIRVDGAPYTVIGVGEAQGKMFGSSMDNWVAVPLTAYLHQYGSHATMTIYVDAGGGGGVMDNVMDQLRTIMRTQRHLAPGAKDAFTIDTSATFQNMLGQIINNFGAAAAALASISLVVGGIVIMNIMLVAVTERTREIGVRKALGAKRKDILRQFLIESAMLSLAGGVIGVVVGIVLAKAVTVAAAWPSAVEFWSVPVSLFVSTAVGLFFGIYPAHKASSLDPITALRAEL